MKCVKSRKSNDATITNDAFPLLETAADGNAEGEEQDGQDNANCGIVVLDVASAVRTFVPDNFLVFAVVGLSAL